MNIFLWAGVSALSASESELGKTIKTLFVLVENYPDLKIVLCMLEACELSLACALEIDTYKAQAHRSTLWDENLFKGFLEYRERMLCI